MPHFIGIDLAWQGDKNHSGVTVLRGDLNGLTVKEFSAGLSALSDVLALIRRSTEPDTVVAIDAPLVIRNVVGQRPCETEISRRFSSAHAGAHTSNLSLYPAASSIELARALEARGFLHCPTPLLRCQPGQWFFEVYPHPAHVVLFDRDRIIKYKKGRVASRRTGLAEFRDNIRDSLATTDPPLISDAILRDFLRKPLDQLKGRELKHYEDILDSLFCAYLAAYFWAWGYERSEMIGDLSTGYIINPRALMPNEALQRTRCAGR
jgi:predicted RNase H-like nuclease